MASIQERNGTFSVLYWHDGKQRRTPTLANRQGAERIKAIIENKAQGPEVALRVLGASQDAKSITLAEWFPKHLERVAVKATDGTVGGYEAEAARSWLPRLGPLPLDTITEETIIEWINWQKVQPTARSVARREKAAAAGMKAKDLPPLEYVSAKTIDNYHSLLSSTLDSAVRKHLIPFNPAKGVPLPKDDVREEMEIFTREEWDRFYRAMPDHYKPFTAFLLATGARMGEATAVRVRDIDFQRGTVSILRAWKKARQGTVMGVPKSKRSRRVIRVPGWVLELLWPLADGRDPDGLLFRGVQGGRLPANNYRGRQWPDALEAAGITKHLTPHNARHTFASWALMDGVAPLVVQSRLGHENISTTSTIYSHLLLDEQDGAVDAIGWEPPKQLEA
ncbi:site-specific integrase [Micrococcus sp. TA1]|uniref:tyrosine-type recombinase/integrase n=1 Tax=Micrococcus sp. TA1 TaxID=681627 RepID=UPI00160BA780|nr:site-specific integrase [Micrococcus sp. TA1]MBB5748592.1 integrase [Micrococcus sp. TA1]